MLGKQELHIDKHGTLRFKENLLVSMLVDNFEYGDYTGLNALSFYYQTNDIPVEHYEQITRLIGYSVDGWSNLSTTDYKSWEIVNDQVEEFVDNS